VWRSGSGFIVAACLAFAFGNGCTRSSPSANKAEQNQQNPTSTAEPDALTTQRRSPVIVAFGDSLTAGVAAGKSYPEDLQELLQKNKYPYRVDNQGVSGDTTTDGLARMGAVLDEHPALVLLEFGGNDGLRGVPIDAIRQNLEMMMERLKKAEVPSVLLGITLPPNYGADYVKSFTAMYPALAKRYDVPFIPFLLLHVYQHQEMMQPDGIHPSEIGNRVVAQDVFNLIQPFLKHPQKK
jgi:acyl-CoA thioesterase-1